MWKIIDRNNYRDFNIEIARAIGIEPSVYLNYILSDSKDYIQINREDVYKNTTIPIEEQYEIDKYLKELSIITIKRGDKDKLKFSLDNYLELADANAPTKNFIYREYVTQKKKELKEKELNGRVLRMKSYIEESVTNDELRESYFNWIDSIVEQCELGKKSVYPLFQNIREFQNTINKYTNGDLDLALGIMRIAKIYAFINADSAIEVFEKDSKRVHVIKPNIKLRPQVQNRELEFSDKVF